MSATLRPPAAVPLAGTRWVQLGLGLLCMMAISSPQYVWALFTKPLGAALGATPASVQVTFSILVVLQTFFSPFQGWLVEEFGPRWLIAFGAGLTGLSWVLAAFARRRPPWRRRGRSARPRTRIPRPCCAARSSG